MHRFLNTEGKRTLNYHLICPGNPDDAERTSGRWERVLLCGSHLSMRPEGCSWDRKRERIKNRYFKQLLHEIIQRDESRSLISKTNYFQSICFKLNTGDLVQTELCYFASFISRTVPARPTGTVRLPRPAADDKTTHFPRLFTPPDLSRCNATLSPRSSASNH